MNRSIESKNEIISFANSIEEEHVMVVIVNINHEVICIVMF